MKFNYNWLTEWIDINMEPDVLVSLLEHLGIEVEELDITGKDAIFSLDITPNRPDLLSIWGIAREISAKIEKPLKKPLEYSVTENQKNNREFKLGVKVENKEDCPRYIASRIYNIDIRPSPKLISERLLKCGIRPLNNVVDITNYVMLETGHPLHAFDYDRIGNEIIVRRAKNGELLTTLEGDKKELTDNDLLIADNKKPIAIAGVMGGELSGITNSTKRVILESAYFKPSLIRKTSRNLKLSTESSYRFERNADIGILRTASAYAIHLIEKYSGGKIHGAIIDTNPSPLTKKEVELSCENVVKILRKDIEKEKIEHILVNIGLETEWKNDKLLVTVPSFRRDIEIEEDLIEEIGRFIGYHNIPLNFSYKNYSSIINEDEDFFEMKRILVNLGFSEAMNIPFIESEWAERFNEDPVRLKNPIWSDKNILRNTLLPGLINCVERNYNTGEEAIALFEIGKVFNKKIDEENMIAGILSGRKTMEWYQKGREFDFYDIKGIVNELLVKSKINDYKYSESKHPLFVNSRAFSVKINNETLGTFGMLKNDCLKSNVYGFEFNFERILKNRRNKKEYVAPNRFPPVKRDLSIVTDVKTSYKEIKGILKDSINHNINIKLIDIYRNESIGIDKKSITIRLEFYHPEKTLTDKEIENDIRNVVSKLSNIGAKLRE